MAQKPIPNVIIFGETGAGKSSVINMILGDEKAKAGDGADGETFESTVYSVQIGGMPYNLHDTVGLGEIKSGTAGSTKAVRNLYRLVTRLSKTGGVHLLVFVFKRGRLTDTTHKNYTLFHHGFCESKIPIVIVISNCDDVKPTMDTWWNDHESSFIRAGMLFDGHACVCAFKGSRSGDGYYHNQDLFENSAKVVKQLIVQRCKEDGWEKEPIVWLKVVIGTIVDLLRSAKIPIIYTKLSKRLTNAFSLEEVEKIIEAVLHDDNSDEITPNVIIFGETGAGKSSVINMILGDEKAHVCDGALGETFKSTPYSVQIDGRPYNLHDTVGMGEYNGGPVENVKAIRNLYRLVTHLSNAGGINLLIFVVKRGRLTETIYKNYTLFHHGFCESKVPIMIVVTGCEDVKPTMDKWWISNKSSFIRAGMLFDGAACVCASRGDGTGNGLYRNGNLVEESAEVVKRLIVQYCMGDGWNKPVIDWYKKILGFVVDPLRSSKIPIIFKNLSIRLQNAFSPSEAEDIIEAVLRDNESIPNIIIFGETGAGNRSVISMILGSDKVEVSHDAVGATFKSTVHPVQIDGKTYNLHDTVGLGEHSDGTVENAKAVKSLYRLVTHLSNAGGVNLLVLVVNCGTFSETTYKTCVLLQRGFYSSSVPIVIVGTNCENVEQPICTWWVNNKPSFIWDRNLFDGHVCLPASEGKERTKDVCQLPHVVERLIVQRCMLNGCKKPAIDVSQTRKLFGFSLTRKIPTSAYEGLYNRLRVKNAFSQSEAQDIVKAICMAANS